MDEFPFEDILQSPSRGHSSDLRWSLKDYNPVQYKWKQEESAKQLVKHVMASKKVAYQVKQVCEEENVTEDYVWSQVEAILHEMAHNFSLGYIRTFGYILSKIFRRLYSHIYVDKESIIKIKSLIHDYPIILVPNHRSYIDFLLISYIFYNYDLPLPSIAAAMDFMSMNGVSRLLRNSGAFFIRRTFATDRLYWAVFTDYIQTIVCDGHSPVEFFLEGTRSRSGKSLSPKLGCLTAVLEPYLTGRVHDIYFIPISVNYNRVTEERLHVYELLGVPKPKESTTKLMRASRVLSEDYGNIYITFGQPTSVREYFNGKVDRSIHNLTPRFIPMTYSQQELEVCRQLATDLLLQQQSSTVISPASLYSLVILAHHPIPLAKQDLINAMKLLGQLAASRNYRVDWNGSSSVVESLSQKYPCSVESEGGGGQQDRSITHHGNVSMMYLVYYKNHAMSAFIYEALVLLAFLSRDHKTQSLRAVISKHELCEHFIFMRDLLQKEVIFRDGERCFQDMERAINFLTQSSVIRAVGSGNDDEYVLIEGERQNQIVLLFTSLVQPMITAYWVVIQYILHIDITKPGADSLTVPSHVSRCQHIIDHLLSLKLVRYHEMLALTLIRHIYSTLQQLQMVHVDSQHKSVYRVNVADLKSTLAKLENQIDVSDVGRTKQVIAKLCFDNLDLHVSKL